MTAYIDSPTLKAWLSDGRELALLDVREHGQFGEGHPFFAVPLPYSRFELGLPALVPNPARPAGAVRGGDGIAERAARRAEALGYGNVHVLAGGAAAWQRPATRSMPASTCRARPSASSSSTRGTLRA